MLQNIIAWLVNLIETVGYPGVALSMFIESFFAPIPSELIMPFAGFVASRGTMNLALVILIGGVASYLGSLPFYFLGYWGNKMGVEKFLKKYGKWMFISDREVDLGFSFFTKYGNGIVLLGRLVPIIRTVISFPAGIARLNFAEFSLYTLIGSTLWSGFLAGMGYILGENYEEVLTYLNRYEHFVLIGLLVLVALYIAYKLLENRKK